MHQREPFEDDLERLGRAAVDVQRVREVHVGDGGVPRGLGDLDRLAQARASLIDVAVLDQREAEGVERDAGRIDLGRAAGGLERLPGDGNGLLEPSLEHEQLGVAGHDPRALGAVVLGEQRDRAIDRVAGLGGAAEAPLDLREAFEHERGRVRPGLGRRRLERAFVRRLRPREVPVRLQVRAEPHQQRRAGLTRERLGVRHAIPDAERTLQELRGLPVGTDRLGGLRGADGRRERCGLVAGGEVVVRERRAQVGVAWMLGDAPLQHAREREMQLGVLAGQQVVVHDLAQQRVAEAVAVLLVRLHEMCLGRFAQGTAQLGGLEPAGLGENVV